MLPRVSDVSSDFVFSFDRRLLRDELSSSRCRE